MLRGRLHVRLRREQPDHPRLADDPAVGRDPPHPDVVHPGATVHGRGAVRLRVDEEVPALDPLRRFGSIEDRSTGCSYVDQPGFDRIPRPLPATADERAALRQVHERVLAVPEEDEVQVEQPLEERDGLGDLVRRVQARRRPSRCRSCPGRRSCIAVEVADGQTDVAEDSRGPRPRARPRSCSESRRSSSKCITDSRRSASRTCRTFDDPAVRVALDADDRVDHARGRRGRAPRAPR